MNEPLLTALRQAMAAVCPGIDPATLHLQPAKRPEHGDLTTTIALEVAKELGRKPIDIAHEIVAWVEQHADMTTMASITTAMPGFINITWTSASVHFILNNIPEKRVPDKKITPSKTIMVEYSSPNIAKPFNVGHLRSTVIGDSIARMLAFLGYDIIRDNHLGDWGTQYGKLAVAVQRWGSWTAINAHPIPELFALYVRFHQEEEHDAALALAGRQEFKKLESGDPATRQIWQKLVDVSLADFQGLYDQLGITFDQRYAESFFEPMLDAVVTECLDRGIARESEGAVLIFFDDPALFEHPLMIRKANGTSTYGTRDLAGIRYRFQQHHLDRLVIEIGNEQELYFRQIIAASVRLGWVTPGQLVHVGHGLFMLPSGKMSTRRGETVWLRDLITELQQRALDIVTEKSPHLTEHERQHIASVVAIGALKYNDLSQNRNSTIVFDKEKSLALEGNSAPYLQYTVARARSVIRADGHSDEQSVVHSDKEYALTTTERAVILHLDRFNASVQSAADDYLPSTLATYLFELAQLFNSFYHADAILKAPPPQRQRRLRITRATADTLTVGLELLGVGVVETM